jgi:hypothetical protein
MRKNERCNISTASVKTAYNEKQAVRKDEEDGKDN